MWVVHWLLHIFHLIFDHYFKLGVTVTTFTFTNNLASSSWNTDTATSINCLAISYLCAIFWWAWPWSIHYCKYFTTTTEISQSSSKWNQVIENCQFLTFKFNFLCQKLSESFSIFFSLKNINLGPHFLLLTFFENFNF